MATATNDVTTIKLTDRQREVWEMSHGLGEFSAQGPMRAKEIAEALGISANAVYVTRRRVRQILDGEVGSGQAPKRIIRNGNHLEHAITSLEEELAGYDGEIERINARLEEIERRKPEVEETLDKLRNLISPGAEIKDEELVPA